MKKLFSVIITFLFVQLGFAQNITVENFQHRKHYFWQFNSSLPLDKHNAVVMLNTENKDFKFQTVKGVQIDTEEYEEGIILKVPDKTKYIIISHPDFGDFTLRLPVKYLKKHNYYTADLVAGDITKEFKNRKQWIDLNISPENAILTMDSVMHRINNGKLSLYLPVGKHIFTLESPFYEALTDSIILSDSIKVAKEVRLQPLYSYLSVECDDPDAEIYVDEDLKGSGKVTVGRIGEGDHRVSLLKNNRWIKDTVINIERAEKKTVKFPINFKVGNISVISEKIKKNPASNIYVEVSGKKGDPGKLMEELKSQKESLILADIHLIAEDSLTKILIDREFVALGEWKGKLSKGYHLFNTEREGFESVAQYIEVKDNSPREIILATPKSKVGILNIHGNEEGISIIINEIKVGETPLLLKDIPADEQITINFQKEGFKEKSMVVTPRKNDITEVYVNLVKD